MMTRARTAWFFALPAFVLVAVVVVFPIVHALALSLFEFNIKSDAWRFVGLGQFAVLLREPRTWQALGVTVLFTVVSVSLEFLLGLGLAMLLHRALVGRGLIRAAGLIPWAIPTVVSGFLWQFIFNDAYGPANDLLRRSGVIASDIVWLGKPGWAMAALVVADVWKTTPFVAILILAGLQGISTEVYESAAMDGAGAWRRFWHITLPMVRPAILVALLFRTLDAFRIFDLVFVMTGGGPGNSTETLSVLTYKTLFRSGDFGMGSALAVFTSICVALIAAAYVLGLRRAQRS
jgi:ABC-type sugar transport system permease subunit